jgi:hypothetical protein
MRVKCSGAWNVAPSQGILELAMSEENVEIVHRYMEEPLGT